MSSPNMVLGAAGNALASASIAASGSANFNLDLSTNDFEGHLQIGATFGTIGTPSGLQVSIYPRIGTTPLADTVPAAGSFVLAAIAGAQAQTVKLQTGRYHVVLTNLDTVNGLTLVYATLDVVTP